MNAACGFASSFAPSLQRRVIDSYDVELQEWIDSTMKGEMNGPYAWDGYFASVTADACVKAKHAGKIIPISISERPAFYDKHR